MKEWKKLSKSTSVYFPKNITKNIGMEKEGLAMVVINIFQTDGLMLLNH